VLHAHVGLDDAPVVDDERVGDDEVDGKREVYGFNAKVMGKL
jgi:hypothetical protein